MKKRISALVLALVLCMALAAPAFAYARVDTEKKTSLSLSYTKNDETPIKGMEIKVYKVAKMTDAVRFETAQTPFAGVEGLQAMLEEGNWADMAQPLDDFLKANEDITPTATATTDENGVAAFTGLEVGAYLVTGSAMKDGYYTYTPLSFVTTLPMHNATNDSWEYDAAGKGKFGEDYDPPSSSRSLKVEKKWVGDDKDLRPTEIKVQLLKDGQPYGGVVVLSQKGGWSHTWHNVSKNSEWSVEEVDVPEGYESSVSVSGTKITITNTMDTEEILDDPTPGGPGPGEELEDPDVPLGNLPQTGLTQWPIPVMAMAGLALLMIGLVSERKRKSEQ